MNLWMESECDKQFYRIWSASPYKNTFQSYFKYNHFWSPNNIFNPNHKNLHNPKEKTITNSFEDLVAQFFADPKKPGSGFKPVWKIYVKMGRENHPHPKNDWLKLQ